MLRLHRPALAVVVMLVLAGAACITMRLETEQNNPLPRGDSICRLTYDIEFGVTGKGEGILAAFPSGTPHCRISREVFSYPGSSMDVVRIPATGGREGIIVALAPSKTSRFTAQFDIDIRPQQHMGSNSQETPLSAAEKAHYLEAETDIQVCSPAVAEVLAGLGGDALAKNDLFERVFEYCANTIALDEEFGPVDAVSVLKSRTAGTLGRARAMVALCRAGQIPARIVSGFLLGREGPVRPHVWAEAYLAKQWLPCDPENGYFGDLPPGYVPAHWGDTQIVRAVGKADFLARFTAESLHSPSGREPRPTKRWTDVLNLTRLSQPMQRTLMLILLVPVGALATAVFRNLIGVQTFGTFTPILLALSFVHADWRTGLLVLIVVVGIGLAGREVLGWLKLLTVPRLSVVLTLVVLTLAFAISVLDYFQLTPAAQAVLLPMVILTMTIERFHISAEEDGLAYAGKVLAGTLAVAFCSFLVLRSEGLGRLLLRFPEGQLFIIATLILIGRYTGYRLTELWRFRDIRRMSSPEEGR